MASGRGPPQKRWSRALGGRRPPPLPAGQRSRSGSALPRLFQSAEVKFQTRGTVTFVIVQWLKILTLAYWESILISLFS